MEAWKPFDLEAFCRCWLVACSSVMCHVCQRVLSVFMCVSTRHAPGLTHNIQHIYSEYMAHGQPSPTCKNGATSPKELQWAGAFSQGPLSLKPSLSLWAFCSPTCVVHLRLRLRPRLVTWKRALRHTCLHFSATWTGKSYTKSAICSFPAPCVQVRQAGAAARYL